MHAWIKKILLSLITLSLTIGLLTPMNKSYALNDSYDESIYEESESYIIDEDESLRDEFSQCLALAAKHMESIQQ